MSVVKPLVSYDLVLNISDYLREKNERDFVLFWTGIYTGRRISDILGMKVRDVKDVDRILFIESKTKKKADIVVHPVLKKIYKNYCHGKSSWECLFPNNRKVKKPLSRVRVWQILNEAARKFECKDNIGCHTLRKTFGYWLYQDTKDIVAVKELLNQTDISVTKRYIGIDQQLQDTMVCNLHFGKIV